MCSALAAKRHGLRSNSKRDCVGAEPEQRGDSPRASNYRHHRWCTLPRRYRGFPSYDLCGQCRSLHGWTAWDCCKTRRPRWEVHLPAARDRSVEARATCKAASPCSNSEPLYKRRSHSAGDPDAPASPERQQRCSDRDVDGILRNCRKRIACPSAEVLPVIRRIDFFGMEEACDPGSTDRKSSEHPARCFVETRRRTRAVGCLRTALQR